VAVRGHIGLAGAADAPALSALLLTQYSAAREFRLLRPDVLAWDGAQGAGGVAAGWDATGRLVATMRARLVGSATVAEAALGVSVDLPATCFPSVILSRAATAPGLSRTGINSVLRWHLLRAALAQGARGALGLVYEAAPRLTLMTEIGYRFQAPARVWDPEVAPLNPPLLAFLSEDGLPGAVAALRDRVNDAIAAWPWQGEAPVIPISQES
jgi:GNAT superfamily N-acetyltransferase